MVPKIELVTAPAYLPLNLTEVKDFIRVDGSTEDTLITNLIKSATLRLEALTDRKFVTQTYDIFFDSFPYERNNEWWDGVKEIPLSHLYSPCDNIKLPFGPMQSVTGVYTYDENNTEYTMLSTDYYADTKSPMGKIYLKDGAVWPATVLRPANGIKIRAVFGFGQGYISAQSPSAVPVDIQDAIKMLVSIMYEKRGDVLPVLPASVALLVEPYRRYKV